MLSFTALKYLRLFSVLSVLKLFISTALQCFESSTSLTTPSLSLPLLPCPSLQIDLNSFLSSILSIGNLIHSHSFSRHLCNSYIYSCSLSLKFLTGISNFLFNIPSLIFHRLSNLTEYEFIIFSVSSKTVSPFLCPLAIYDHCLAFSHQG